jgi:hypothetical protein
MISKFVEPLTCILDLSRGSWQPTPPKWIVPRSPSLSFPKICEKNEDKIYKPCHPTFGRISYVSDLPSKQRKIYLQIARTYISSCRLASRGVGGMSSASTSTAFSGGTSTRLYLAAVSSAIFFLAI